MEKETNIAAIKKSILSAIDNRYGSVANFLKTDFAKGLGGNVRVYLYPSGAVSFPILSKLCEHLEIGTLAKEVKVVRSITYTISKEKGQHKNNSYAKREKN